MNYNDIPSADGSLDDINRPKRTTLKTHQMIICYSHSKHVITIFM